MFRIDWKPSCLTHRLVLGLCHAGAIQRVDGGGGGSRDKGDAKILGKYVIHVYKLKIQTIVYHITVLHFRFCFVCIAFFLYFKRGEGFNPITLLWVLQWCHVSWHILEAESNTH